MTFASFQYICIYMIYVFLPFFAYTVFHFPCYPIQCPFTLLEVFLARTGWRPWWRLARKLPSVWVLGTVDGNRYKDQQGPAINLAEIGPSQTIAGVVGTCGNFAVICKVFFIIVFHCFWWFSVVFGVVGSNRSPGIVEFTDFIPWYLACFAGEDGSPLAPWLYTQVSKNM